MSLHMMRRILQKSPQMTRSLLAISTLAIGLVSTACLWEPPIDEGLSPEEVGVIEGTALIAVPISEPAPIILSLKQVQFDETTGAPIGVLAVNLTVIPAEVLAEGLDADARPVLTGDFTFPLVEPGVYYIEALVDVDNNFHPILSPTATPGDVVGGYVQLPITDPANVVALPITVSEGQVVGQITVFLGSVVPYPDSGTVE